jgi:hypothetical protein
MPADLPHPLEVVWIGVVHELPFAQTLLLTCIAVTPAGPFINNCVGRGNLRPFLLFLLWTLLAAAYALAMCSVLVWREWDVVRESAQLHSSWSHSSSSSSTSTVHRGSASPGSSSFNDSPSSLPGAAAVVVSPVTPGAAAALSSSSMQLTASSRSTADGSWADARLVARGGMLLLLLQVAPGWLLATYYLAAASAALLLAVGALLASQLSYLGSGVTYIQFLKQAAGSARGGAGSEHDTAAAGGDSFAGHEHEQQANGDRRPYSDMGRQEVARQHDGAGLAAAAAGEGSGTAGSQQLPKNGLQQQPGKWRVLWSRVKEVLGVESSSCCSVCWEVLVPRWQPVAVSGTAAVAAKKWS